MFGILNVYPKTETGDYMPIQMIRNDITKMDCDAIVNAANSTLLGGGGVDGAIHRAAGPGLLAECRTLGGCAVGQAKATGAYRLPCRYVIHTVGPVWRGGGMGEKELLTACYRNSLAVAEKLGCESVAFPLISSGVYGYPKDKALRVAVDTVGEFLAEHEMLVYIVIFDRETTTIGEKLYSDIRAYIDDCYAREHGDDGRERIRRLQMQNTGRLPYIDAMESTLLSEQLADDAIPMQSTCPKASAAAGSLQERLQMLDESFSEMLLRKIDEKGMTAAQCYKKANIDRKLFSKIHGNRNYKPSKQTAVAFAVALELPLDEARELLCKAGFALSHSSRFDIIIEYFVMKRNYNIFEINEALFAFDQPLLG